MKRMYLKKLREQRAAKIEEMKSIVDKAKAEVRAMSEEERQSFDSIEAEIRAIDASIAAAEKVLKEDIGNGGSDPAQPPKEEERAEKDVEEFAAYIRNTVLERRADTNMTVTDNGAIIPESIANKIITKVVDICPIFRLATRYNVGGTLNIPYYDETEQSITMAYATEFTELESKSGKMLSIELKGYLAGALTKISKSLINNSSFDVVSFVVNAMADAIARWIEKELLQGTSDKIDGLSKAKNVITAAAADAVTADELIDLQEAVADAYQAGAIWIMNKATRTAIRKLKDKDGNYILNKDATARWGYTLFGKDVYTSDNAETMASGKTAIYYGDMSGLAVKMSENVSIEILREKFATQHAVGVVGWVELDSKIENEQKVAVLKMGE